MWGKPRFLQDINVQFADKPKRIIRIWNSVIAQDVKEVMNIAAIIYLHTNIRNKGDNNYAKTDAFSDKAIGK